ncbi:GNAT family N-acetyltransferase [Shewanella sp. 125m-7]
MVNYNVQSNSITIQIQEKPDFLAIRKILEPVSSLYPDFDAWFNFRFRGKFKTGDRIVIAAMSDSQIAGVALLKKTNVEHKICTLYVREEFRQQGAGSLLLTEAIKNLQGKKIGISVSEERHLPLKTLLDKYGFTLVSEEDGYYRKGAIEYFYELNQ